MIAAVAIALVSDQPRQGQWWVGALGLGAWAASPIVVGVWAAGLVRTPRARRGYLMSLTGNALFGLALMVYVLFIGPQDALNVVVIALVPFYQWLAMLIALAIAWFAGRRTGKAERAPRN